MVGHHHRDSSHSMPHNEDRSPPPSNLLSPDGKFLDQASQQVQEMIEAGASRCEILTRLATAAEILAGPGSVVSILVLNEDGVLRNGASPNLPVDYLTAIDRLKPDAKVGTLRAAAATGLVVITPDLRLTTNGRSCVICRWRWVFWAPGACPSSPLPARCWGRSAPISVSAAHPRPTSAKA